MFVFKLDSIRDGADCTFLVFKLEKDIFLIFQDLAVKRLDFSKFGTFFFDRVEFRGQRQPNEDSVMKG